MLSLHSLMSHGGVTVVAGINVLYATVRVQKVGAVTRVVPPALQHGQYGKVLLSHDTEGTRFWLCKAGRRHADAGHA